MPHPPVLIENWLPTGALSVESIRERASMTALPPTYYLHVWWARRPLIASRAAVLAGVLPAWRHDWPEPLRKKFPTAESYRTWFFQLAGILGDPVEAGRLARAAKAKGLKLKTSPYNYDRAFKVNPAPDDLETMLALLELVWGRRDISIMDPMAGGGSIPFESLRYGFTTFANELNPVPAVILTATLDYPARFGPGFARHIRRWGDEWADRVREKLAPFFPRQPGENIRAYLWARTVACPVTGKSVPLAPNWRLRKGGKPVAVRLMTDPAWNEPRFEIVNGEAIAFDPGVGTIKRGTGRSPWTGETISSAYIKQEAQAGRLGQRLYAVALKQPDGVHFRSPTNEDLEAVKQAEVTLLANRPRWEMLGLIPDESFPTTGNDLRPIQYGMSTWADFFSPRQLLALVTFLETLHDLKTDIAQELPQPQAQAVETYLGLAFNKCPNYSSRLSVWHPLRAVVANTFNRHDFSFSWSHAEFDAAHKFLPWVVDQVERAYRDLAKLTISTQLPLWSTASSPPLERLTITQGAAAALPRIPAGSIHNITVDPPYYDNVMYAELSDFFYVWLKRSVGHLFPAFFTGELTNKDDEAVANPARFAASGPKKKDLAEQDYERKMAAAFREMYRVLHPHGVLTVMFTHKRVEAWDALATALIGAGFTIKASWPIHTESEHSLHQAKKNAAASTILLVCRKRETEAPSPLSASSQPPPPVRWADIKEQARALAGRKAQEYDKQGLTGVDLYLSVFGPTLSLISKNWPVLTGEIDPKTNQPRPLRLKVALDLARMEVIRLHKEGLLTGRDV